MKNKKTVNPEIAAAVLEYIKAIENSKNNPDNKILKIKVGYVKYIIKSLILKEFIKTLNKNEI
jgi:hypothetical protein